MLLHSALLNLFGLQLQHMGTILSVSWLMYVM